MAKKNTKTKHRPAVPNTICTALIKEAGFKCANPGCPNTLTELHHITEWHIYHTHDEKDMIAICPTCHSHAHYGQLKIDALTIRRWKAICRPLRPKGHIYIEPGQQNRLLLGSIYMTRNDQSDLMVFRLSARNQLSFRVINDVIMNLSLAISDTTGCKVVSVIDGHVFYSEDQDVKYQSRPGRVSLTVPANSRFVSAELLKRYAENNPPAPLVVNGRITLLDLEVIVPGTVQVRGVWDEGNRVVVVTEDWLSICSLEKNGFCHFKGYGEKRDDKKDLNNLPVFEYSGPLSVSVLSAAFKFREF